MELDHHLLQILYHRNRPQKSHDGIRSLHRFRRSDFRTQNTRLQGAIPLARVSTLAVKEFRLLEKADVNRERKRLLVKDTLRRVLKQGISKEMRILTRNLPFLATCANAAPFIGLFGTVWGIMHSFHSIGLAQSAALATVAPGISEALIATAIGLLVAIPATIFYNYFLGKLNEVETGMVDFAGAFLNRAEREIAWSAKGDSK